MGQHLSQMGRVPPISAYRMDRLVTAGAGGVRYALCGRVVEVVTDDPDMDAGLRRLFRVYQQVGAAPPAMRVSAQRTADGYAVETTGRTRMAVATVRCPGVTEAIEAIEFAVSAALLERCQEDVHVHAGGAVFGGRAALVLGRRGAGKSSLAFCWSVMGRPSLGDDIVFADREGCVRPFCRFFKVAPALVGREGLSLEATPFWAAGSAEAWYDPAERGGWAVRAPVGLVVVASYRTGASLAVRRLGRPAALNALVHSIFPSGLRGRAAFDAVVRIATGARACEVRFGDARTAADALAELAS